MQTAFSYDLLSNRSSKCAAIHGSHHTDILMLYIAFEPRNKHMCVQQFENGSFCFKFPLLKSIVFNKIQFKCFLLFTCLLPDFWLLFEFVVFLNTHAYVFIHQLHSAAHKRLNEHKYVHILNQTMNKSYVETIYVHSDGIESKHTFPRLIKTNQRKIFILNYNYLTLI